MLAALPILVAQRSRRLIRRFDCAAVKLGPRHAKRRFVGAGIDAADIFAGVGADHADAQIAGGGGPAFAVVIFGIQHVPRVGPHADVAVGAVLLAQAAADAVVFDFDFVPFAAVNGIDRAADQAVGIFARAAGAGDQVFAEPQPFALEPRDAAVGIGAGFGAFIAASAAFQIEHQQLLGVEQALVEIFAQVRIQIHPALRAPLAASGGRG